MFWVALVVFTADRVGSESGCATPGILSCGGPAPTLQTQGCRYTVGKICVVECQPMRGNFRCSFEDASGVAAALVQCMAPAEAGSQRRSTVGLALGKTGEC